MVQALKLALATTPIPEGPLHGATHTLPKALQSCSWQPFRLSSLEIPLSQLLELQEVVKVDEELILAVLEGDGLPKAL